MTTRLIATITTIFLLTGCGKKTPATTPPPAPTTTTTTAENSPAPSALPTPTYRGAAPAPAPVTAPVVAAPVQADMGATLNRLTDAVRRYSMEHRQVPTSLGEVVAAGYIQGMPQATAGKKFAIDPKQVSVVLVNQ